VKAELESVTPPERLSITHLLVWTAMSAVLLGYQRAMSSLADDQTLFSTIITLWYAPLFGAGVSACVLSFWRLTNGGPRFPVQPGHWLLIISGIGAMISLVFQAVSVLALAGTSSVEIFLAIRLVEFLFHSMLYGVAAWRSPGGWRVVFVSGVVQSGVMSLLIALVLLNEFFHAASFRFLIYIRSIELGLYGLVSFAVLIMAIVDRIHRPPRDYLHWTGVAVRLIYSALIISIPYLFRWLQKPPT
jgi:hypothetical protein